MRCGVRSLISLIAGAACCMQRQIATCRVHNSGCCFNVFHSMHWSAQSLFVGLHYSCFMSDSMVSLDNKLIFSIIALDTIIRHYNTYYRPIAWIVILEEGCRCLLDFECTIIYYVYHIVNMHPLFFRLHKFQSCRCRSLAGHLAQTPIAI